jgi:50S ribosomal protein L16 3-hydroxylase
MTAARFGALAGRGGLRLDRRTRMAWRGTVVFVNGEALDAPAIARRWLRALADRRALTAAECLRAFASAPLAAILHCWYEAGWLHAGAIPGAAGATE